MSDHYNLLGVAPEAGPEEIRRAFRREAKRCHPDLHAHRTPAEREAMQRRFILVAQAYQVLGDPDRRRAYDHRRAADGYARGTAPAARPAFHERQANPSGTSARGSSAGSGPHKASSEFSATPKRRGAADQPASAPRSPRQPAAKPEMAELRDILREAEQNLSNFGLDLRQPAEAVLEELVDWARALYRDLVGAVRGAGAGHEAASAPQSRTRRGTSKQAAASTTHTAANARGSDTGATHELAVERELEQLKRGKRTGTPHRPATVDDELAELKRKHGRKSTTP